MRRADGANGSTEHRHLLKGVDLETVDLESSVRGKVEKEIMISLTGEIAQRKHDPRSLKNYHDDDDRVRVGRLAMRVTGSGKETEAYLRWLQIRAENMIRQPRNWDAVQALAEELIHRESLTGQQAKEVLQRAFTPQPRAFRPRTDALGHPTTTAR